MKSLQTLVFSSLLLVLAPMAHASSSFGMGGDVLSSDTYAQDTAQTASHHPGDPVSDSHADSTRDSGSEPSTSSHLPTSSGKVPEASSSDSARAASWQSLLPGSIQ